MRAFDVLQIEQAVAGEELFRAEADVRFDGLRGSCRTGEYTPGRVREPLADAFHLPFGEG